MYINYLACAHFASPPAEALFVYVNAIPQLPATLFGGRGMKHPSGDWATGEPSFQYVFRNTASNQPVRRTVQIARVGGGQLVVPVVHWRFPSREHQSTNKFVGRNSLRPSELKYVEEPVDVMGRPVGLQR